MTVQGILVGDHGHMACCRLVVGLVMAEAQEGSPPQVTRSLFFKAPGHQVTFFHEKIKTTQVTGRFFKLSRSRGRPQNGPRSQVAKNPSWASWLAVGSTVGQALGESGLRGNVHVDYYYY